MMQNPAMITGIRQLSAAIYSFVMNIEINLPL